MGIDVYLKWDGMTPEEHQKQITGYSVTSGHVGYLREAYHGSPYAIHALITEDWKTQPYVEQTYEEYKKDPSSPGCGFSIPNAELKKRLPNVLKVAAERNVKLYGGDLQDGVLKAYKDFVALHGKKEKAGLHPRIVVSY